MSTFSPDHGTPTDAPRRQVRTERIIFAGIGVWAVALVITLAVPALNEDGRDWWPWSCVAGIVLGLLGYAYVRRGRGNAAPSQDLADPPRYY